MIEEKILRWSGMSGDNDEIDTEKAIESAPVPQGVTGFEFVGEAAKPDQNVKPVSLAALMPNSEAKPPLSTAVREHQPAYAEATPPAVGEGGKKKRRRKRKKKSGSSEAGNNGAAAAITAVSSENPSAAALELPPPLALSE